MMRIPINLASAPFRRDRPVLVSSIAGCFVLTVTLVALILAAMSERNQMSSTRAELSRLNSQLSALTDEQNRLDATLRKPQNAVVLERSLLLNTLLQRKGISWTRIFADLEKVTPYNVRLMLVRLPQITSQNQVMLDMQVGAKEAKPIVDFLKNLAGSPLFGPVTQTSALPPSQTDPLFRYRVLVTYAQRL
jgi:type IV pilus assembly protein PilN